LSFVSVIIVSLHSILVITFLLSTEGSTVRKFLVVISFTKTYKDCNDVHAQES